MAWLLSIDAANIPQRRLSPQNLHKLSKIVREWLEKLVRWKKSGRKSESRFERVNVSCIDKSSFVPDLSTRIFMNCGGILFVVGAFN